MVVVATITDADSIYSRALVYVCVGHKPMKNVGSRALLHRDARSFPPRSGGALLPFSLLPVPSLTDHFKTFRSFPFSDFFSFLFFSFITIIRCHSK
jgi:hypothetical protein